MRSTGPRIFRGSRTSCSMRRKLGWLSSGWTFSNVPVNRLSTQMTLLPCRIRRSHRFEPMNPAPPVTTTVRFETPPIAISLHCPSAPSTSQALANSLADLQGTNDPAVALFRLHAFAAMRLVDRSDDESNEGSKHDSGCSHAPETTCSVRFAIATACRDASGHRLHAVVELAARRPARERLAVIALELNRTMRGRVRFQHALACRDTQLAAAILGQLADRLDDVLRGVGDQQLAPELEEGLDAGPAITDDGRAAGRRLEQAHARRKAGHRHVAAGEIEGVALGAIERGVPLGREMLDAVDIGRPADVGWILGTGDDEPPSGQPPRRLDQQALERRLAILAIGPKVAELPGRDRDRAFCRVCGDRRVHLRVDGAVQRAGTWAAVEVLDQRERRAAGERQVEGEARNGGGAQVVALAAVQPPQRHRRIDVVERRHTLRAARD